MESKLLYISLLILFFFSSCKKNDSDTTNIQVSNLQGYVQKGPYINGTSITLYKLNSNLEQLGTSYSSQILDNKGTFQLSNLSFPSKYVLFYANGFYYNEVIGAVSLAPLQLYGLADITNATTVNVNVMTHLERRRVEYLIKQGKTFSEAKKTAQQDILNIFGFQIPAIKESEKLDINVQGDENAILLAVSLIFQGNLSVGDFSELLSIISADMEQDGKLDNVASLDKLKTNVFALNVANIRKNLETRYQSLGLTASIPNFEKYIQQYISTFPIDITSGLIAYYPFNGNANDESGNGNNGIVFDATLTSDRFGNDNKAYSFDGNSSYISLPLLTALNNKSVLSFSFWINTDFNQSSSYVGVFSHWISTSAPSGPIGIQITSNPSVSPWPRGIGVSLIGGDGSASIANILQQAWQHIVILYDGKKTNQSERLLVYINGNYIGVLPNGTQIIPESTGSSADKTVIGACVGYIGGAIYNRFKGLIDDFRIYNRPLNELQINYLATH